MISVEEIHEAFMRQVMRAMAAEAKVKELEAQLAALTQTQKRTE